MKHLKNFKLFETGEWSSNVSWQYAKEHPDEQNEEVILINTLQEKIESIIRLLNEKSILILNDIRGFDMSSGPYAKVTIFGRNYRIWIDEVYAFLFIEDFPISNTDDNSGLVGDSYDIAELLNDIYKNGGGNFEVYKNINKYNL
jgi:hypothetical protein